VPKKFNQKEGDTESRGKNSARWTEVSRKKAARTNVKEVRRISSRGMVPERVASAAVRKGRLKTIIQEVAKRSKKKSETGRGATVWLQDRKGEGGKAGL